MARIQIRDIARDAKISKTEMKHVTGGTLTSKSGKTQLTRAPRMPSSRGSMCMGLMLEGIPRAGRMCGCD